MRKIALAVTLSVTVFLGCSTRSALRSPQNLSEVTDLGKVELADDPWHDYTLSGDRVCRVRLTQLVDGQVLVELVVLGKDAQGQAKILARPRRVVTLGQRVSFGIDRGAVALTPEARPAAGKR